MLELWTLFRIPSQTKPARPQEERVHSEEEKVIQLRHKIDALLTLNDYDAVGELPGFSIIRRWDTFKGLVNCSVYTLGISGEGDQESFELPNVTDQRVYEMLNYPEVKVAEEGDCVIYLPYYKQWAHIGVAVDSNTVRSKFGFSSHVYQHPIGAIPTSYGNKIKIVPRDKF